MTASYDLFLNLMTRCLTDSIYDTVDERVRAEGRDWPARAHTMIGFKRLANIRTSVETVLDDGVPGDFIETGVWRGGATIFMRAILKARAPSPTASCGSPTRSQGFHHQTQPGTRTTRASPFTNFPSWLCRSNACKTTSGDTAYSTTWCDSSKAGSATRCQRLRSTGSRSSGSTATCTNPQFRRSILCMTNSHPADS